MLLNELKVPNIENDKLFDEIEKCQDYNPNYDYIILRPALNGKTKIFTINKYNKEESYSLMFDYADWAMNNLSYKQMTDYLRKFNLNIPRVLDVNILKEHVRNAVMSGYIDEDLDDFLNYKFNDNYKLIK